MAEFLNFQDKDPDNTPAPQGHDEEMIKKFDAAQQGTANPTNTPTKPEGVPDKFWNAETGKVDYEGLTRSYNELSKMLGERSSEKKPEENPEANKPDDTNKETDEAKAAAEKAGIDFDAVSAEYVKTGKIADDVYDKLEKTLGMSRAQVDQYAAGQMALAEKIQSEVFDIAGGKDAYGDMIAWAAENLSPAEVEAFNKTLDTQNVGQWKLAVQGLYSKYTGAVGSQGRLLTGETAGSSNDTDKYESLRQYVNDVKDPRYNSDHAFRAKVLAKLARSPADLR